jgi:hypothetical protein
MKGVRRGAVVATMAALSAACEALIGITDREVAPDAGTAVSFDASADTPAVTPDTGPGDDGADSGTDDTGSEGNEGDGAGGADGDGGTSAPPTDAGGGGDALDAQAGYDHYEGSSGYDAADGYDGAVADPDVPCGMQPPNLFCDDFDSVGTVGQGWMYSYVGGDAGVLQLDTATYVSAPVSAQVVMTPQSGIVTEAQLGTTLGPVAGGVRVAFDVRIDVPTYSNFPQVCVVQVYLRKDSVPQQLNFVVGSGGTSQLQAYLPDAGASLNLTLPVPTLGSWMRVVISFTVDGLVSVIENGVPIGSENIGAGNAGLVQLIAGAAYINPFGTETVTLEMDNIVVRAQ